MCEKPLISVLMGIYNCEKTLEEAIQCIIDQTYENWELIMCDDCSTDNTYEIAKKIERKDSRIRVIKNDHNRTLAPSLNRCLGYANGEYIARMDGDDICTSDRFEKELDILMAHPEYALVSCNMNLYDTGGVYRVIHYAENPEKRGFVKASQFCHAGCMMRTSVLRELGGYSEEMYCARVEDYDLWVRMYALGYRGYNIQETLYSMRDDRDAHMRRTFKNRLNETRVEARAVKLLNLNKKYYVRTLIPLLKCLIPNFLYKYLHKKIEA
jgi:glycosyltransferase EpsE